MLNLRCLNQSFLRGGGWPLIAVTIGSRKFVFRTNTLQVMYDRGNRSAAQFVLINPIFQPNIGEPVIVRFHGEALFTGTLHRYDVMQDFGGGIRDLSCECIGPEHILERRLVLENYTSTTLEGMIDDQIFKALAAEGFSRGVIDGGPVFLLVEADNIRMSEFLRDVAGSVGALLLINQDFTIDARISTFTRFPVQITNDRQWDIKMTLDREHYRNAERVRVSGVNGAQQTVSRDDGEEISVRQAIEGGSGRYERFDEIQHPTSNATEDLIRLGITYAVIKLRASASLQRTLTLKTRRHHLRVGYLLDVDIPAYQAAGDWLLLKLMIRDEDGIRLVYEGEARQSDSSNMALEAYLNLTEAGRAVVVLSDIAGAPFQNEVTFNTVGVHEFEIPGTPGENVEIEIQTFASSGGAGGSWTNNSFFGEEPACNAGWPNVPGGQGGAGGKAISFKTILAGTILTITITAAGTPGNNGEAQYPFGGNYCAVTTVGTAGGNVTVQDATGVLVYAQGGGGGGVATFNFGLGPFPPGPAGQPGGGSGDVVTVGGGPAGGQPNVSPIPATGNPGVVGSVLIRY